MPTYQSETEDLQTILHVSRLAQGIYHLDLRVHIVLNRTPIVLELTALYNTTGSAHVLLIPPEQIINLPSHSQLVTSPRDEFLVSHLLGEGQHAAAGTNPPVNPQSENLQPEPVQAEEEANRQSSSHSSES